MYVLRSVSLVILVSCLCLVSAMGQSAVRDSRYLVEVGTLSASAQTPFWLRANRYGVVPLKSPYGWVNTGMWSDYRPADSLGKRPKADWGYGVNAVVNAGATTQVLLPEAYVKGRLGALELYVGRRREINGLVDTLLTTGAYSWSGNALPIPKIQLSLPTYTPIPFTKGIISVLGAYSHGWFENSDRYIKGSYLHQTYLYGRLGKPTWRFRLYGGFTHQVIWAGHADPPGIIPPYLSDNGKLPSAFKYYPAVVIGERGLFSADDPDVTSFEANRIGNHLGSVDFAADVNIAHWNLFMYRQFMYDDGSLFYLTNIQDGLNGIRLKNQKTPDGETFFLRQLTLEYLYTGSQGGNEFVIDDPLRRGNDDYFNHAQFIDGWTYFGRTIGNPFLTPTLETNPNLPHRPGITNNRVSAGHFGLSALLFGSVDVIAKLSYSVNAGTYPAPFLNKPRQFSGFLSANIPVNVFGGRR
ncbi:capsule assembly Wzi family protein [Spirosoma rhododendri]|uniref:capsule assembly Wzi family protein n=1 Tax=Spirosoma rhododendri TaxID=2728024 RepID=UPI0020C2E8EE|nr:capsule assembly Wzi family protein [Spirosoma rhododendri]